MGKSKREKTSSRGKKGGKYHNKAQMQELLTTFFQQHAGETMSFKQIFKELRLNTHPLKMLAIDVMQEMAWDDFLSKVSDNAYRLNTEGQVLEGRFVRKTNGKNSFIPDGSDLPIFVSERNSMWAMNGDRVKVTLMARRANHIKEAMVVEILSHEKDTFVGTLQVDPEIAFLNMDSNIFSSDIIIPIRKLKGGKTGDKAVVKVVSWPSKDSQRLVGEVIDILGQAGDNTTEMHAILAKYGLPYRYPKEVEEAAKKITGEITPQDLAEREDYRDVWTCTIDPHDAKDYDDAVSILRIDTQNSTLKTQHSPLYEVAVHIADVSHYVKEGDIIDKEAQKRATSIYLVDRTIPMLPEHLCNYVCSLRPDEDKLCYSVIFQMDAEANVKSYRIAHTIIRSNRRYAYEEAQALLEQNGVIDGSGEPAPAFISGSSPLDSHLSPLTSHPFIGEYAEEICTLDALAKELRKKRYKNGAIDFDSEEMKFDVDEKGHPTRCYFKRSKDANKLIEEFMLLANRTVAESVGKVAKGKEAKTLPYRVHDNPDPQKMEELRTFVGKFGYKLKSSSTKGAAARSMNQLIHESQGTKEQKLIQMVTLRAMMKAKYTTHNIGHFGLAFDYYTHFTSPIRRYPDTMVHRLLTQYQNGGKSGNRKKYEELCEHSSNMEQIAQNAERDSIKYKMVEFMSDKIGNIYDAHISGITSYGIYCEIDENHCEGMIMMRDLGSDYYDFDEKNYCLVGRRRHHKYQLGDPIRIRVARANLEKRQLDFTIEE